MQKNKIGTVLLLVMTIGLLGAVVYFSFLLSNKGEKSVTQIKKTKASAQTYHKLLALNVTPQPSGTAESSSSSSSSSNSSVSSVLPTIPVPTLTPLLALNNVTPTTSVVPTVPLASPTSVPPPTSQPAVLPSAIPTTAAIPTNVPTPTIPLLVYRTMTPTMIPVKNTGGGETVKTVPTATPALTKAKPPTDKLPETGWVQYSSILFIVAAATVFISFLF